jgi:predicted transcriptional regulator
MAEISFRSDGLDGFRRRVLDHARMLDCGDPLPSETTVSFESPQEMFRVLSPRRILLLQTLTSSGGQPVDLLAESLGRNRLAIARDLGILRKFGAVEIVKRGGPTTSVVVRPVATRYDFVCSIRKNSTASRKVRSAEK